MSHMENISDVYVTDYIPTIYTSPCTVRYTQNGKTLEKDIFAERNGICVVVYNKSRDTLTLVRQFRAAVYLSRIPEPDRRGKIDTEKYPASLGVTLEFCAGLEDKQGSSEEIAREEVLEECGYDVKIESLEKVCCFANMTETTGARATLYYCEVTDDMRVSQGGGNEAEGECIEVVEMTVDEVLQYVQQSYVNSPMHFLWVFYWFLCNKHKQLKK